MSYRGFRDDGESHVRTNDSLPRERRGSRVSEVLLLVVSHRADKVHIRRDGVGDEARCSRFQVSLHAQTVGSVGTEEDRCAQVEPTKTGFQRRGSSRGQNGGGQQTPSLTPESDDVHTIESVTADIVDSQAMNAERVLLHRESVTDRIIKKAGRTGDLEGQNLSVSRGTREAGDNDGESHDDSVQGTTGVVFRVHRGLLHIVAASASS